MATENFPIVALVLPDGRKLKAVAVDDENFPAINIEIVSGKENEKICFVEFNPERKEGDELSVGVFGPTEDEILLYESYKNIKSKKPILSYDRLKTLLYNAIVMLEKEYCTEGESMIYNDLADEVGITYEEYEQIIK